MRKFFRFLLVFLRCLVLHETRSSHLIMLVVLTTQAGFGRLPQLSPKQQAALHSLLQNCVQQAGLPVLPPISSGASASNVHREKRLAYEMALNSADRIKLETCHKKAFQLMEQSASRH